MNDIHEHKVPIYTKLILAGRREEFTYWCRQNGYDRCNGAYVKRVRTFILDGCSETDPFDRAKHIYLPEHLAGYSPRTSEIILYGTYVNNLLWNSKWLDTYHIKVDCPVCELENEEPEEIRVIRF